MSRFFGLKKTRDIWQPEQNFAGHRDRLFKVPYNGDEWDSTKLYLLTHNFSKKL